MKPAALKLSGLWTGRAMGSVGLKPTRPRARDAGLEWPRGPWTGGQQGTVRCGGAAEELRDLLAWRSRLGIASLESLSCPGARLRPDRLRCARGLIRKLAERRKLSVLL